MWHALYCQAVLLTVFAPTLYIFILQSRPQLLTSFSDNLMPLRLRVQVLTIVKQEASAAAVGGVYALMFLLSGSLMAVGTAVITALGLGPFLSILAVLHFSCSLAAFIQIIRSCSDSQEPPEPLISRHGSAAFMRSAYRVVSTSFKDPQDAVLPAGRPQHGDAAEKDLEMPEAEIGGKRP